MKKTLREIIQKYNLSVRLTPNQNIILCDIRNAWKRPITTALAQAGLLVRYSCSSILFCGCTFTPSKFFSLNQSTFSMKWDYPAMLTCDLVHVIFIQFSILEPTI